MGAQLFLNLFASALLGSVVFITYYYLSRSLGSLFTFAILLLVALVIILFGLWRAYAPNLDFLSFLEDYGEGKLGYKKGGQSRRQAPNGDQEQAQEQPSMVPEEKAQEGETAAQDEDRALQGSQRDFKTRLFSFFSFLSNFSFLSKNRTSKKQSSKKEQAATGDREGEALVSVSTPPGPIFAGGMEYFKNNTNLTKVYRYIEKGEYGHALQALKKVSMRYSGKKVVQNDLGVLYYMQRKWDQALLELQRVESEAEDSLILQYNIALAMLKLKKNHEAIDRLNALITRKEMPQALFHLAVLFYRIGQKDKADKMLQRAKELGYDYSPVWPPEG